MTERKNFYVRLQPNVGSELNEVAEWLNSKSAYEKNQLVGQALVMCYLFSARLDSGENNLTAAGLNCCNAADKHFDNIKRVLFPVSETHYLPISDRSIDPSRAVDRSFDLGIEKEKTNIPLEDIENLFAS